MTYMTKILSIFSCLILISSCELSFPLYQLIYQSGKTFIGNTQDTQISEETFERIDYAFIRASFGIGSPKSILILVREKNNVLEWISAESEKIYTFNGKIIKTSGLPHDIEIVNYEDFPEFTSSSTESKSLIVNFMNPELFYQEQYLELIKKNDKQIPHHIKGRSPINALLYEENIYMPKIYWEVTNTYHINPDSGQIERTVQKIHPDLPPISIDFIKNIIETKYS